jgi:hypothetical protein
MQFTSGRQEMLLVTSYSSDDDEESSNKDSYSNDETITSMRFNQFNVTPPQPKSMKIENDIFNMYLDNSLSVNRQ